MASIPSTKASRPFALAGEQMDVGGPATETRSTLEGFADSRMGTAALEGRSKQDSCLEGPDRPSGVSSGAKRVDNRHTSSGRQTACDAAPGAGTGPDCHLREGSSQLVARLCQQKTAGKRIECYVNYTSK